MLGGEVAERVRLLQYFSALPFYSNVLNRAHNPHPPYSSTESVLAKILWLTGSTCVLVHAYPLYHE